VTFSQAPMIRKKHFFILLALTVSFLISVYAFSLTFGYIGDDKYLVPLRFSDVSNLMNEKVPVSLLEHFRPLWFYSYPFVNIVFGMSAFSHHFFNVLLACLVGILSFIVGRECFELSSKQSIIVTRMWLCYPSNFIPVFWISQRNDLLMTFFVFIAVICLFFNRFLLFWFFCFSATLSKTTSLFFPFSLLSILNSSYCKSKRHIAIIGLSLYLLIFIPPSPVTFRKGVTPRLPFRRPAPKVAALVH